MDEKNRDEIEMQQIENELRDLTDDIQVPPSLEPGAVEEMLYERARKKKKTYRWKYAGIAAAACLCVIVGAAALLNLDGLKGGADRDAGTSRESAGKSSSVASDWDAEVSELVTAADYDEIYEYIQADQEQAKVQARIGEETSFDTGTRDASAYSGASGAAQSAVNSGASAGSTGYSDTNVREEGIGEADTVKTDGENLYILNGQTVSIVGVASEEMQPLSEVSFDGECYIREIYVEAEKLVILYTKTEFTGQEETGDGYYKEYTCADVYDVSDPSSPEKVDTVTQSGNYKTMRVSGGYVYLLSEFYALGPVARTDTGVYIPEVQGKLLEASAIYMPQTKLGSQYTVISAFALDDPSGKTDSKAVFGIGGICYVSGNNIYITESYYGTADVTQTSIRRITYADGKLTGAAQTKVDGTLNDSFSIDEYNGYLRMVVTIEPCESDEDIMPLTGISSAQTRNGAGDDGVDTGESSSDSSSEAVISNALYVLNEDLEMVGSINGLAEEEHVYSARFMGDIGYFVTFKQVDPLFSVDLTDPEKPKVIGELKIPGFSEYLHPYGDGKLLGIGMAVDEEGVTTEGIKISMFDVSDPENVEETSVLVLEDLYGADALYNYKAVFVDTEKNLFGFSVYGDETEYDIFSYDDGAGFRQVFSRRLPGYGDARGLYAGERFYLIAGNTVESYTLSDFQKVDDIVL